MPQALEEGICPYPDTLRYGAGPGRSPIVKRGLEKSAEACPIAKRTGVIVVGATSYAKRGGLTTSEGLNVRLFQML